MSRKIGGRLAASKYKKKAELLGDYYYYQYSGISTNSQAYGDAAIANGFTGGSVSCSEEIFTTLSNIS